MEWRGRVGEIQETSRSYARVRFEWLIPNPYNMPDTPGAIYFSPEVPFAGSVWFWGIYRADRGVCMELWRRCEGHPSARPVYFSLSVWSPAAGWKSIRLDQRYPANCHQYPVGEIMSSYQMTSSGSVLAKSSMCLDSESDEECESSNVENEAEAKYKGPILDESLNSVLPIKKSPLLSSTGTEETAQACLTDRMYLSGDFRRESLMRSCAIEDKRDFYEFTGRNLIFLDTEAHSTRARDSAEEVLDATGQFSLTSVWIRVEDSGTGKFVVGYASYGYLRRYGRLLSYDFFSVGGGSYSLELSCCPGADNELLLCLEGPPSARYPFQKRAELWASDGESNLYSFESKSVALRKKRSQRRGSEYLEGCYRFDLGKLDMSLNWQLTVYLWTRSKRKKTSSNRGTAGRSAQTDEENSKGRNRKDESGGAEGTAGRSAQTDEENNTSRNRSDESEATECTAGRSAQTDEENSKGRNRKDESGAAEADPSVQTDDENSTGRNQKDEPRAAKGTADASVQTDEHIIGAEIPTQMPDAAERNPRLWQLFKQWLQNPEEGDDIRRRCKKEFELNRVETSPHISEGGEKHDFSVA